MAHSVLWSFSERPRGAYGEAGKMDVTQTKRNTGVGKFIFVENGEWNDLVGGARDTFPDLKDE